MTKFTQPIQLLAHDKNGTSDCSEKDDAEVFLVNNGVEPPYWCTPQEMLTDIRRCARVIERQNGNANYDTDDTTNFPQVVPVEDNLSD